MAMDFEFATAGRLFFGPGVLGRVAPLAAQHGTRALLVTGRTLERAMPLISMLKAEGIAVFPFAVSGEPSLETVSDGVRFAKEHECTLLIGLGGGSVIDAGKAIAALVPNGGDPLDYLEVIGKGRQLSSPSLPYIAIPTTAGTGSEVTKNAVLTSTSHHVKVSLRSPSMLPLLAVIDPELTLTLPPALTASTGLDALTQLIEPYVSTSPNPLTDALCREGIRRAARSLRRACSHGDDIEARTDMSLASLFGGMALANARLGAVHGLAGPLGGLVGAPHGAVCARLLPLVMAANIEALKQRNPNSPVLFRYEQVAQLLTGNEEAGLLDAIRWLNALYNEIEIPDMSRYGLTKDLIPAIVAQSRKASSMKGNPVELSESELSGILEQAMK